MQMPPKPSWGLAAGLVLAASLPITAHANDGAYLGFGGGLNFESPTDVLGAGNVVVNNKFHNGFLADFTVGYATRSGLRPEFEFGYRYNKLKAVDSAILGSQATGGHYQSYDSMLNLWYDFKSSDPASALSFVHPYLGGGVGLAAVGVRENVAGYADAIDDKNFLFAYQVGTGIGFDFTRHMTLSFDARWLRTSSGDFAISNDVIDVLGGPTTVQTHYDVKTIGMTLRYSFGEPGSEANANHTTQPDDSVITPVPVAPSVAPAAAVNGAADSDGDGVPDSLDQCPNTPKGFHVDGRGCIVKQTVVLRAVNFQFNSDQLTDPAKETLDSVAAGLVGQPSLEVEIDGHTDSVGSAAYNLKLSARRAAAVRRYLIAKGVEPQRLTARGFGAARPVASNQTAEGRAQNRRVEFVVLGGVSADATIKTAAPTEASTAAAQ